MLPHHSLSQINSIDVTLLSQIPGLACLDLQNNSIGQVPPQLGTVTTLKSVHVDHMYFILTSRQS